MCFGDKNRGENEGISLYANFSEINTALYHFFNSQSLSLLTSYNSANQYIDNM